MAVDRLNNDAPTGRVRRMVVKVGSALIAGPDGLDAAAIDRFAGGVAESGRGAEIVLVSSGAVAGGYRLLSLNQPPRTIVQKQAAAALGQQRLMRAWSEAFAARRLEVAQALLTSDDVEHRRRFINARHTLDALLRAGVVPIVNENDTVSFEEIRLGDNDRLSALVAHLVDADLLLILTSADGLREAGGVGARIDRVRPGDAIDHHVAPARTFTGVGGMETKVAAARLAAESGVPAIIASGAEPDVIQRAASGEPVGTLFEPVPERGRAGPARKRWIVHSRHPRGRVMVDEGARCAICERGASLLPAGVVAVEGDFDAGAAVDVIGPDGRVIARGLCSYGARDLERIRGVRTEDVEARLGYRYTDEVIHRDDLALVIVDPEPAP